ncbi:MAG: cysteine synthase A [Candidatus Omnitrophota bacterium]
MVAAKVCAGNALELIGNTPLLKLNKIVPAGSADVFAKLEFFNPGGSVKDRIAFWMVEEAERSGILRSGATIVEPTSGNTGIGLALVGAVKGYKVMIIMPDTMTIERRRLLSLYGAEVILTPGADGMRGAIKKAQELLKTVEGAFMPHQFENPLNPEAHRIFTAPEILKQTAGGIDAFVCGVGTGGTITGVGEVLKKKVKGVKIYAVEPASSAVLSGGPPGQHKIQGIGAGFIPKVLNREIIDEVITVEDKDAFEICEALSKQEGVLAGVSSGAACWASLKVAAELGKGKRVVTIFPDSGERYLSLKST